MSGDGNPPEPPRINHTAALRATAASVRADHARANQTAAQKCTAELVNRVMQTARVAMSEAASVGAEAVVLEPVLPCVFDDKERKPAARAIESGLTGRGYDGVRANVAVSYCTARDPDERDAYAVIDPTATAFRVGLDWRKRRSFFDLL